ncbi:DPP IV N-terminal domain-containing protein [uncultured Sphingomonas sp.]|uniref:S9 family peptidase n=1 Tax=uncultured Sphingomonas sp. TaxID=158754 RepID=UPI0035CB9673
MKKSWLTACLALAAGGIAMATDTGAAPPAPVLTLARIFASPDLSGPQLQSLQLSPDGRLVTLLKPRADEKTRFDLWALDTTTGTERMLVDSKKVGSGAELSEAEKMQRERDRTLTGKTGIVSYDWSVNGSGVLFPLDGDLYFASSAGEAARLEQVPRGALNPALSPLGGYVSFVHDGNLYTGSMVVTGPGPASPPAKLTPDGGGTVHWGEAEFVAQEEMARRTGYWWAPDDARVAVERFDEAPVGVVTRAAIGANGTKVFDQRYPAAGTPNVLVDLYVIDPQSKAQVKVDLGTDRDIYLARVDWAPDGKTLYVQRENRAQTRLDMLRVDPATGKAMVLFTETAGPRSWINLSSSYHLMKDGSLIWWSERDGYGHLYHFARGTWTQLTSGPWVVSDLVGVDEARGRLYFTGDKDDVLEQQVYAVDIARPGKVTLLTERGWTNRAAMDAKGSRLIVTRSNPGQPPQTYLADTEGKRIAWISENALVAGHPYFPYLAQHRERKFGTLKGPDGSTLYWEMITPPLIPGKRYPVFFQHYGGPHSQTVTRGWGGAMEQYIVGKGYVFFQVDNRGSPNRGTAFEDQIYRAMGSVEVEDQLAGAQWLKRQPFVDPDRIAIYGWSYGGYMTLKMLAANPGVYAAGIAGAPVTKWELYDTHYTERYMGMPAADAAAYATSDAIGSAGRIADPLLLIHGMSDDNVVFENSTAFAAAMQAQNRRFEMMFYPGKTHAAARDIHVWTTIFDYLDRTVAGKRTG